MQASSDTRPRDRVSEALQCLQSAAPALAPLPFRNTPPLGRQVCPALRPQARPAPAARLGAVTHEAGCPLGQLLGAGHRGLRAWQERLPRGPEGPRRGSAAPPTPPLSVNPAQPSLPNSLPRPTPRADDMSLATPPAPAYLQHGIGKQRVAAAAPSCAVLAQQPSLGVCLHMHTRTHACQPP